MARQLVVRAFGLGLVVGLLIPGVSTAAPQAPVRVGVITEGTSDPQGKVRGARARRSQPMFEEAAVAAVRQWKYEPTLLDGTPVSVLMTVVVNFPFKAADPAAQE